VILAITFLKTAILAIFYQEFGHKLRKKSGKLGTEVADQFSQSGRGEQILIF